MESETAKNATAEEMERSRKRIALAEAVRGFHKAAIAAEEAEKQVASNRQVIEAEMQPGERYLIEINYEMHIVRRTMEGSIYIDPVEKLY